MSIIIVQNDSKSTKHALKEWDSHWAPTKNLINIVYCKSLTYISFNVTMTIEERELAPDLAATQRVPTRPSRIKLNLRPRLSN